MTSREIFRDVYRLYVIKFILVALGLLFWNALFGTSTSEEMLVPVLVFGVLIVLESLDSLHERLGELSAVALKEQRQHLQASDWALRNWEATAKLPEEARNALDEITKTKLYRWVEQYEKEIKAVLPIEARQAIYEIAETRR